MGLKKSVHDTYFSSNILLIFLIISLIIMK